MPAVSILMAVFNGARYVEETVRSLQGQTLADWELLVVDDGSEDQTPRLLARLAAEEPRLSVTSQSNRGLTPSLNRALVAATGTYVARIDVGDIARPDRLAVQKEFLDRHGDHVAVGSHLLWITPEGWPVAVYRCPLSHEEIDGGHVTGYPGQMAHACVTMRREALMSVGGYDEEFVVAQDYDLLLRLAEVGRLANVDDVLTKYRVDPEGVSSRRRDEQVRWAGEALRRARKRRGLPDRAQPPLWTAKGPRDVLSKWVREAIESGYYSTARRYAWRLLLSGPTPPSLRLFLRAVFEEARGVATGNVRVPQW
jgi:glycosyltransferase involved in cell wall biosynthesis